MLFDLNKEISEDEIIAQIKKVNKFNPRVSYENISTLDVKEQSGNLYIDYSYQRNYIKNKEKASSYIESIFLGLVIPELQIFEDRTTSKREVIDGQQRLLSLLKFYRNEYPLTKLEKFPELNGKRFRDLPEKLQNIILNYEVCLRVSYSDDVLYKYILFERLNTGSKKLNPQEIRNCIYRGELLDLVKNISKENFIINIFSLLKNDRFDIDEYILNILSLMYFEYISESLKIPGSMKLRINHFLELEKELTNECVQNLIVRFLNISKFIYKNIDIIAICRSIQPEGVLINTSKTFLECLYLGLSKFEEHKLNSIDINLLNKKITEHVTKKEYAQTLSDGNSKRMSKVNARIKIIYDAVYETLHHKSSNITLDSKRFFNQNDKMELFLKEKNKNNAHIECPLCSQPIYDIDLAEVDHVIPWSKGGRTEISNGQLVHATCNRLKSNKDIKRI